MLYAVVIVIIKTSVKYSTWKNVGMHSTCTYVQNTSSKSTTSTDICKYSLFVLKIDACEKVMTSDLVLVVPVLLVLLNVLVSYSLSVRHGFEKEKKEGKTLHGVLVYPYSSTVLLRVVCRVTPPNLTLFQMHYSTCSCNVSEYSTILSRYKYQVNTE